MNSSTSFTNARAEQHDSEGFNPTPGHRNPRDGFLEAFVEDDFEALQLA